MSKRPTDDEIRRFCNHWIEATKNASYRDSELVAFMVDHLLWSIGDEPNYVKAVGHKAWKLLNDCDAADAFKSN